MAQIRLPPHSPQDLLEVLRYAAGARIVWPRSLGPQQDAALPAAPGRYRLAPAAQAGVRP